MRTSAVDFAELARTLSEAARLRGLEAPVFASPPRRDDLDRSIRRRPGSALVAVRIGGRPLHAVAADMIEGVIVANDLGGPRADRVRAALWLSVGGADDQAPSPALAA